MFNSKNQRPWLWVGYIVARVDLTRFTNPVRRVTDQISDLPTHACKNDDNNYSICFGGTCLAWEFNDNSPHPQSYFTNIYTRFGHPSSKVFWLIRVSWQQQGLCQIVGTCEGCRGGTWRNHHSNSCRCGMLFHEASQTIHGTQGLIHVIYRGG